MRQRNEFPGHPLWTARRGLDYDVVTGNGLWLGADMSGKYEYHGIQYSVTPVGTRRWRWEVAPPLCVLGLKAQAGEIEGERDQAVRAAVAAIKNQGQAAGHSPE